MGGRAPQPRALPLRRTARLALGALTLSAAFGAATATAAFPAQNGEIAFTRLVPGSAFQVFAVKPDGSGERQITSSPLGAQRAAWSADGTKVAFDRAVSGFFQVFVANADGTDERRLTVTPLTASIEPTWSPDGTRVAFRHLPNNLNFGDQNIFLMNADGTGNPTRLTSTAGAFHPSWSPDGTRIAFADNSNVFVASVGGGVTPLTTQGGLNPSWSPDGSKIAFDKNGNVFVMNADGTNQNALTTQGGSDPSWSPDGTQIAFVKDNGIFTMNASDGSSQTRRADGTEPDWGSHGAPACAAPEVQVGLAVAKGCFTERMANGQGTGVFETSDEAWVGGFHLKPRPGGKLVVQNRPAAPVAAEGAGVDWLLGIAVPAPLDELKPFLPDFTVGVNTSGSFGRFVQLPLLQGLSGQVKVTWDAGGKGAKAEASVSMEELTKSLGKPLAGRLGLGGVSVGTFAAKLGLVFANGKPADVTEGELEVPEYAVELKGTNPPIKEGFGGAKFKAKKVGQSVEWSGEVTLLFPWQAASGANQGVVKGRLFFQDFEMAGLGLSVSGFEQPIGKTGWDFTGVEGDVLYRPAFAFNVGVTAQQHSSFAGVHLFKLTGNVKALALAATDCPTGSNPVGFLGTFNAPPLEAAGIGEFKGQVVMCAYLSGLRTFAFEAGVSGDLTVDVGPFKKLIAAQGSAKGWFSGFDFNLDGSYRLQLPVIGSIGADGVISSEGYAICGRYGFISAGIATNNWLESPNEIVGCDFTPFRAAVPAPATGASTNSITSFGVGGNTRTVKVAPGQTAFAIAIRGTTDAPRVRVVGPNGERFTSPEGASALKTSRAISYSVDELKTTYMYVKAPRAGAWKIEPLDGSASIRRVDSALQLPKPRVRARVTRRGQKVVVTWQANTVAGRKIALVERANGVVTQIQSSTSKRAGRVTFTPANPLATRRTIEAVILQDGSPRPSLTVATYRLSPLRRPGRPRKPVAKLSPAGLAIAWQKAPRAAEYLIEIKTGSTVLTRTVTKRLKLTFRNPPAGQLTVLITPRDTFGRPGPTTTLRTGKA
jgi:WD40-like Beta Propeller Repeat